MAAHPRLRATDPPHREPFSRSQQSCENHERKSNDAESQT
jgi:hypothetical protein